LKQLDSKRINHYIKQTANGNESAFDKLFVYTYDNMKHIAKFYLKNKSNADDVLVEFYKIILDKVNSFDSKENGYNWMYTIAKNLALNDNQKNKKIGYISDGYYEIEDNSFQPLKTLIVEETMAILNDKEKELLYRLYWEGYTIKEIAEKDNIPTATFYKQRKRIFKKMKKFLKNWIKIASLFVYIVEGKNLTNIFTENTI